MKAPIEIFFKKYHQKIDPSKKFLTHAKTHTKKFDPRKPHKNYDPRKNILNHVTQATPVIIGPTHPRNPRDLADS